MLASSFSTFFYLTLLLMMTRLNYCKFDITYGNWKYKYPINILCYKTACYWRKISLQIPPSQNMRMHSSMGQKKNENLLENTQILANTDEICITLFKSLETNLITLRKNCNSVFDIDMYMRRIILIYILLTQEILYNNEKVLLPCIEYESFIKILLTFHYVSMYILLQYYLSIDLLCNVQSYRIEGRFKLR